MSEYFCGIGKIPKGKTRGSIENCMKQKQIRYYGIVAVDPKLVESKKKVDLQTEMFKLKKIEQKAKDLIKEFNHIKLIINKDISKYPEREKKLYEKEIEKAKKKGKELMKKRDPLIKKMNLQKKKIDKLEKLKDKDDKKIKNIQNKKVLVIPPGTGQKFWNQFIKKHSVFIKDLDSNKYKSKPKKGITSEVGKKFWDQLMKKHSKFINELK